MSKYDDVQRFKDKINMKNIDYKEFPREDAASPLQRWSIVEQIAGTDNKAAATFQPTLPNATDFFSAASLAGQQQFQPTAAVNENKPVPAHVSHNFEHLAPMVAPKPNNPPPQEAAPVFSAHEHRAHSSSAERNAAPQTDAKRFKNMFSKKTSSAGEMDVGRNTLLKPLLESIASCR
ncbi:hypothetical protein [Serratia aquatilis]|uniref:Cellulose biosynthesis protein BcsO n=1 Tax=Serratia aquatilis TaxID=1737515 RepID=A0ABV6EK59_9GAMM